MAEPRNTRGVGELSRKIFINDQQKNVPFKFPKNQIQTRKYTIITFLPKFLFIQFLRLANVYFLISAIISSIDEVSSIGPVTSIVPLAFVLTASILREAFEDWKRYKNDKSINNQKVDVYHVNGKNAKAFAPKLWKKIAVGEFVKVKNNEEIPADMILLTSSDEHGLAYVETANLDGERNLKLKQPNSEIKELVDRIGVGEMKGVMLVESPNQRIHHFKGIIEIEGLESVYLTYNNLLIRGTHLKNTDYAIGLVVYTGHDSKLLKNQGQFRNKRSSIERQLNKYIIFIFIIQLLLCLLLTILHVFFKDSYVDIFKGPSLTYLFSSQSIENETEGKSQAVEALITFASFLLLLNTMIPISLMVSLEVTKWFQSTWLEFDVLMWEGQQKSKVLNMLIHEDLGRVDYIFADKTGTLTSNEMRFKYCSIDGVIFSKQQLVEGTALLVKDEDQLKGDNKYKKFWLTIGMCHDIVINHKAEDQEDPRARYQGSSPDEVELVSMASEVNYTFKEKRVDIYTLDIDGRPRDFKILVKIDFSSDRKRMSIIARELETHKIYLFCKGADSIILQRIRKDTSDLLLQHTNDDLQAFSKEGLRTLVIAYKELEEEMFMEWYERYQSHHREQYNVADEEKHAADLAILEDEMEKDLVLLGVTALEDKLQEGVAETIRDLHKAGIKIWMLTGDKMETAENIGYATNLIAENTLVFRIKTGDPDKTMEEYQQIESQINKITKKSLLLPVPSIEEDLSETPMSFQYTSFALIIDGEAISCTFNNPRLKGLFIHLIPQFRTVVCCRSTPSQKADVVTFVKTNLKKLTLAIGDGGNDVNMIQKADIGVGIFGKEGNQAAFASDYAFVKFFFLWRLLLVHGRWFYLRTSNFINFFFYKNLIFTLPQFWFALYSGYSGQSIYDDSFITNYNTVFTSVAPVYYAAQEQDVNPRETETIKKTLPYLYAEFRDKIKLFGPKKFTFWWAMGFAHSLIVFYVTKATYNTEAVNSDGFTFDLWDQSVSAFAGIFCTVFTIIIIGTNLYQAITFICYGIFTFLLYFPIGSVLMDHASTYVNNILWNLLGTPKFWLCLFLTIAACAYLVYIPKQYFSFFEPNLADLLQRDRNKKWKNTSKEAKKEILKRDYVFKYNSEEPFDFNKRTMLRSWWYNPKPVVADEGRNE